MKEKIKEILPYIIIIITVALIRLYIITPEIVSGESMENNLHNGEWLLNSKITYKFNDIKRFDIVIIKKKEYLIIKRVIGLPGETVEYKDNKLYINGELVEDKYAKNNTNNFTLKDICYTCEVIPDGKYLVLGDNREISSDSRSKDLGLVSEDYIIGKAVFRIWPLTKFGTLE